MTKLSLNTFLMNSHSYYSRKSTDLVNYLQRSVRTEIPAFLQYFSTSHHDGKKLFQRAINTEESFSAKIQVDRSLFFYLFSSIDTLNSLLYSLGRLYDIYDIPSKRLLLRAVCQHISKDRLRSTDWIVDDSKIKSAKQTNKTNSNSLFPTPKPPVPPSKQRLSFHFSKI